MYSYSTFSRSACSAAVHYMFLQSFTPSFYAHEIITLKLLFTVIENNGCPSSGSLSAQAILLQCWCHLFNESAHCADINPLCDTKHPQQPATGFLVKEAVFSELCTESLKCTTSHKFSLLHLTAVACLQNPPNVSHNTLRTSSLILMRLPVSYRTLTKHPATSS